MKMVVLIILAGVVLLSWILWILAGSIEPRKRVFMRIMDILLIGASLALIVCGIIFKKEYDFKTNESIPEEYRELTDDELIEEGKKYGIAFEDESDEPTTDEKKTSDKKIKKYVD